MFLSIKHIKNLDYPYHLNFPNTLTKSFESPTNTCTRPNWYAQQDVSLTDLQTTKCGINELTEFMED